MSVDLIEARRNRYPSAKEVIHYIPVYMGEVPADIWIAGPILTDYNKAVGFIEEKKIYQPIVESYVLFVSLPLVGVGDHDTLNDASTYGAIPGCAGCKNRKR